MQCWTSARHSQNYQSILEHKSSVVNHPSQPEMTVVQLILPTWKQPFYWFYLYMSCLGTGKTTFKYWVTPCLHNRCKLAWEICDILSDFQFLKSYFCTLVSLFPRDSVTPYRTVKVLMYCIRNDFGNWWFRLSGLQFLKVIFGPLVSPSVMVSPSSVRTHRSPLSTPLIKCNVA